MRGAVRAELIRRLKSSSRLEARSGNLPPVGFERYSDDNRGTT
jgi:hypothetical protein